MSKATGILWTDHTFNPWWGCAHASPGCEHCYAETFAKRTGHDVWGPSGSRRFFGDKHWNGPRAWNRDAVAQGKNALVFCASMADVFEDREDLDEQRVRLFSLIAETPHLTWQLLTKRPQHVAHLLERALDVVMDTWAGIRDGEPNDKTPTVDVYNLLGHWLDGKAPANVWLGTTIEDERRNAERWAALDRAPARTRFLSMEPLLEFVDPTHACSSGMVDWIIVGGESGPKRRPFDPTWATTIVYAAESFGVPVFVKQDGALYPGQQGHISDAIWSRKNFPAGFEPENRVKVKGRALEVVDGG